MKALVSVVDKLGFLLLTFSVVVAPIPFGSNYADAAGLVGSVLAVCLVGCATLPMPRAEMRQLHVAALILAAVVVLITVVQVLPIDTGAWADLAWSNARGLIETSPETIVASRYQPLHSLGYVLMPLAAFIACLVYVGRDDRFVPFLHAILGASCLIKKLCIGQYVLSPGSLLWAQKRVYLDSFTGTFVNRNSAATYFGILLVMSLSLLLNEISRTRLHKLLFVRQALGRDERAQVLRFAFYCLWTIVFAAALLLTKSRAGIFSALIGVVTLVSAFAYLALRPGRSGLQAAAVAAACAAAAIGASFVLGAGWVERLQHDGIFDPSRACTYKSLVAAIKDHFWLGAGLGTFQDLFPAYRLSECGIYGFWEMGHNVFLEGLLALGVAFVPCVGFAYYRLIGAYVYGVRHRQRWRFVPLSCLSVVVLVTTHSLVDFSLQIPGVALLTAALLGAGAAVSVARSRRQSLSG